MRPAVTPDDIVRGGRRPAGRPTPALGTRGSRLPSGLSGAPPPGNSLRHLAALVSYGAIFGGLLLPKLLPVRPGRLLSNSPADGSIFLWSLGWWAHAVPGGHLVPYTHALFAPGGTNLAWTTSVPTAGLLLWPVTRAFGVFAVFNASSLLAPVTAAWTTYLLVLRVTGRRWPAFVSGLLFGASPLETTQVAMGHLNLSLVALVPLAAYLVVRRLDGSLGPRSFVFLLGLTLAAEFGLSTEVFVTTALFGGISLVLAYVFDRGWRPAIRRCAALAGMGYALACALVSPMLYAAFALPHPAGLASTNSSISPMSGVRSYLRLTPGGRPGSSQAAGGPLVTVLFVLPLLAILLHLAWKRRRQPAVRALGVTALVALVLSAGIVVVGSTDLPTPWALANHIPLIRLIRPQRLTMFAWLIASVGVGVWLSERHPSPRRWAASLVAVAALLPAFWIGSWTSVIETPPFFTETPRHLASGVNVAVVAGPGSLSQKLNDLAFPSVWQAQSNFSFRLANAYVGSFPPTLPAAVRRFELGASLLQGERAAVMSWLRQKRVGLVLVMRPNADALRPVQDLLGTGPLSVGGAALFVVPGDAR